MKGVKREKSGVFHPEMNGAVAIFHFATAPFTQYFVPNSELPKHIVLILKRLSSTDHLLILRYSIEGEMPKSDAAFRILPPSAIALEI